MSQHFKLPLSQHPKVPYAIVDANGVHVLTCGINGDGEVSGTGIALDVIAALNGPPEDPAGSQEPVPASSLVVEDTAAPVRTRRKSTEE